MRVHRGILKTKWQRRRGCAGYGADAPHAFGAWREYVGRRRGRAPRRADAHTDGTGLWCGADGRVCHHIQHRTDNVLSGRDERYADAADREIRRDGLQKAGGHQRHQPQLLRKALSGAGAGRPAASGEALPPCAVEAVRGQLSGRGCADGLLWRRGSRRAGGGGLCAGAVPAADVSAADLQKQGTVQFSASGA